MKLVAIATAAALTAFASNAIAADLIIEEEAIDMAVPAGDWTGFYAGLGVTGAYNAAIPESLGFVDVIVGANVQADSFVFGAEAYLSGWTSSLVLSGWSAGAEVRAGYLVTPEALIYLSAGGMHFITGGASYGQVGAGVEFMVTEDLSLDFEYRYWMQAGGAGNTLHSISASALWHF